MDSVINKVIESNGIKVGEPMKTIRGNDIEGSMVLDSHTYIIRDGAGAVIRSEEAIGGRENHIRVSKEGLAALKNFG